MFLCNSLKKRKEKKKDHNKSRHGLSEEMLKANIPEKLQKETKVSEMCAGQKFAGLRSSGGGVTVDLGRVYPITEDNKVPCNQWSTSLRIHAR